MYHYLNSRKLRKDYKNPLRQEMLKNLALACFHPLQHCFSQLAARICLIVQGLQSLTARMCPRRKPTLSLIEPIYN